VPDIKSQNKIHYYIINELEDVINLTLIEDDITEVMKNDDKGYPIMINLKENDTFSKKYIKIINFVKMKIIKFNLLIIFIIFQPFKH